MTPTFVTRRLLTNDEKYRRAIFFYTYDMDDFELFYVNDVYEEDKYRQPQIKIKENFDRLDDKTKALVLEFVKREVYDETIDLKCLKCSYEEHDVDWEMIEEGWNVIDYPKLYCPKCGKPHFIPLEIWKQKNKYRKQITNLISKCPRNQISKILTSRVFMVILVIFKTV